MRENKPVLLVLSAYDGKLFLRKGEFLSEKRHEVAIASNVHTIR